LSTLPRSFFGRSSTKTTQRGYLCLLRCALTWSCNSAAIRVSLPEVDVSLSEQLGAGIDTFRAMRLDRAYAGAPARARSAHGVEMIEKLGEMVATEVLEAIGAGR